MKTTLFVIGAALLTLGAGAHAQVRGNGNGGNGNGGNANNGRGNNNRGNGNGGGQAALPLPDGVENLVSIDAFNILLAQTNHNGQRDLSPIIVQHVYSGGIARLFGGTTIPTQQFVSPGTFNNSNGGGFGGGNGGFGNNGSGSNGGGNNGFGNNGGGFGNNSGGFGGSNGGFGGNTGGNTGGGFGGGFGSFLLRPVAGRGRN